ncbi:ECF transporter S component [Paenarthrobacter sp. DKR-5]|uniref:general stress protein n=1 Tax=Paenarthrobacter sp. DKR-5 TaxID=2835535 RepID=UPI001BDD41A0|nr:ECF transporter S component [Paenarthrobacter sp. DKR-5]
MSNIWGTARQTDEQRSVPRGDAIGSYTSYLDAQKAVDYLADHQFPVQHVSIVGNDLKMVEQVTGKLSYPRVALNGALTGVWFGLLIGMLLSFFGSGSAQGPFSIITSVLMGAAFWMLFGVVTYAMQRGKRDFTSTNRVLASSYDVIVGSEFAGEARRLLQQLPMESTAEPRSQAQERFPGEYQGQAPQRPAGWEDPYAKPAAGAQGPAAEAPATPRGQFPDLPDGRPQYGVRVDKDHQRGGQQEAGPRGPEQPAREQPAREDQDRDGQDRGDQGRDGEDRPGGGTGSSGAGSTLRPPASGPASAGIPVPEEPQSPWGPAVPQEPQGMPGAGVPEEPQGIGQPQPPVQPPAVPGTNPVPPAPPTGSGRPGNGTDR